TGGPTVSHTYSAAGNYTASVVETDSAGASVPPAPFAPGAVNGPGTTPYLDASPAAAISAPVAIGTPNGPPPPTPTTTPSNHGTTSTTVKHAPPAAYHPVIKVVPPLGSPGGIVTVTGQGFPPNKNVKVEWSTKTGSFEESSDSHGNLPSHLIFILTPDVLGPRFAVATVPGTSLSAQAPFLVVPGSAQPGGRSGDVLFRSEGP
ncbi:MAG TPA: hypothetical protein VFH58_07890, partial [Acidimicrobiales bacterium]|nr:hypothetical protein [Acidimicrobiales bacterium]